MTFKRREAPYKLDRTLKTGAIQRTCESLSDNKNLRFQGCAPKGMESRHRSNFANEGKKVTKKTGEFRVMLQQPLTS